MFNEFSLGAPLLQAVQELGYVEPTPVQQRAIPVVLQGRDLLAAAQRAPAKRPPLCCRCWRGCVEARPFNAARAP